MFKILFDLILNLVATLVQIVCTPINAVITATMPDLTSQISSVTNTLGSVFSNIAWGVGLLPDALIVTLLFIISIEIVKLTIYISTHSIIKVWEIIQKVKFW